MRNHIKGCKFSIFKRQEFIEHAIYLLNNVLNNLNERKRRLTRELAVISDESEGTSRYAGQHLNYQFFTGKLKESHAAQGMSKFFNQP